MNYQECEKKITLLERSLNVFHRIQAESIADTFLGQQTKIPNQKKHEYNQKSYFKEPNNI